MAEESNSYSPPPVSKHYRFDWQFAIELSRVTGLRFLSILFLVIPIIIGINEATSLKIPDLLYVSAASFFFAVLIILFRSPRFIQEYSDYGKYLERKNSHRWIVWQLYTYLDALEDWGGVIRETVSKGLSVKVGSIADEQIREKILDALEGFRSEDALVAAVPIIVQRDIYLPFIIDQADYVLFMKEDEETLEKKEKELFWIIFTAAAKQYKIARAICWVFIVIAIGSFSMEIISFFIQAGKLLIET